MVYIYSNVHLFVSKCVCIHNHSYVISTTWVFMICICMCIYITVSPISRCGLQVEILIVSHVGMNT